MKKHTGKIILVLIGVLLFVSVKPALANTTYYNYGSGYGTSQTVGKTSYYNDSYGWRGTSSSVGQNTYYNYNNSSYGSVRGSTQQVGNTTYYSGDIKGSGQRVGNSYYYRVGNQTGSCYRSGRYTYCN